MGSVSPTLSKRARAWGCWQKTMREHSSLALLPILPRSGGSGRLNWRARRACELCCAPLFIIAAAMAIENREKSDNRS